MGQNSNRAELPPSPLVTIASATLKRVASEKGKVYGNDFIAANLVLQLNNLRYKDGKGDPRGFKAFLDSHNLPGGFVPRYRGNRLHILFHIFDRLHRSLSSMMMC